MVLAAGARAQGPEGITLRVAEFEVGAIRTRELLTADTPRLKRIAEVIQRVRPNVLLLSGIAYDTAGGPDVKEVQPPGQNGQRFADAYLAVSQGEGLAPLRFKSFSAPVNSGMASGMDLDHSGSVVTTFPLPGAAAAGAEAYSGDCWGPGAYPGEHGMALLVDERLTIQTDKARTFRRFPWEYVPSGAMPPAPGAAKDDGSTSWYTANEKGLVRLSSVGHWDVPVALPDGSVLHLLCSRPIPPGPKADGAPTFASRRNHDEIRFWADYVDDEPYLVDDSGVGGGLASGALFVVMGNLGVAPRPDSKAGDDVIGSALFGAHRVNSAVTPTSETTLPGLDPIATTFGNLRADYLLPSREIGIAAAGIWRAAPAGTDRSFPSEHFPVYMDLVVVPAGGASRDK
jgi:hypothetical protein